MNIKYINQKSVQSSNILSDRRQGGFTLIEIMISIVIISTAIAAVLYYQDKAEGSQKALSTVRDLTILAAKIHATYGPQNSFATLTSSPGIAGDFDRMGIIPGGMKLDGTSMRDPYGNLMAFSGGASTFTISIGGADVPIRKEECVSIATGIHMNALVIQTGATAAGIAGVATPTAGEYKKLDGTMDAKKLAIGCSESNTRLVMQFR